MFKPTERLIYRYWDGTKTVCADPMRLSQKLLKSYPKESGIDLDFKLLQLEKDESLEAFMRIVEYSRAVFDLKEYTEDEGGTPSGVTDAEALMIFVEFASWMDDVKGKLPGLLRLPTCTDQESSNGADSSPTMKPSLDSGSTEGVSSLAAV